MSETKTETEQVEEYRAEKLQEAGFSAGQAKYLSTRHNIDLHNACSMVSKIMTKNGVDSEDAAALAFKILR